MKTSLNILVKIVGLPFILHSLLHKTKKIEVLMLSKSEYFIYWVDVMEDFNIVKVLFYTDSPNLWTLAYTWLRWLTGSETHNK